MILANRHPEGKHYVIITPNHEFSGKRLGVVFVEGTGRTKYEEKARVFDETFGYDVRLGHGMKPWVNAVVGPAEYLADWKAEPSIVVVDGAEEPEDDDTEPDPRPVVMKAGKVAAA